MTCEETREQGRAPGPCRTGKRYEDWELEDPAGKGIDTVRRVRDDIRGRVETLIGELLPAGA